MQGDLLASDMSAFKAANPGAVLEDFVRWHSPREWLPDADLPLGGRLSPRIVSIAATVATGMKEGVEMDLFGLYLDFSHDILCLGLSS